MAVSYITWMITSKSSVTVVNCEEKNRTNKVFRISMKDTFFNSFQSGHLSIGFIVHNCCKLVGAKVDPDFSSSIFAPNSSLVRTKYCQNLLIASWWMWNIMTASFYPMLQYANRKSDCQMIRITYHATFVLCSGSVLDPYDILSRCHKTSSMTCQYKMFVSRIVCWDFISSMTLTKITFPTDYGIPKRQSCPSGIYHDDVW